MNMHNVTAAAPGRRVPALAPIHVAFSFAAEPSILDTHGCFVTLPMPNYEYELRQKAANDYHQAKEKARVLLYKHLSPEQARCYNQRGYFEVKWGESVYRLGGGEVGVYVSGVKEESWCVGVKDVPYEDELLTLKLWIESNNVKALRRNANVFKCRVSEW
jgi:hypothetical protein